MNDWNSKQYLMFKNERTQPAIDLANRITVNNPENIVDIGCGPGNSTQVIAKRYPDAYVLGCDNSPGMLETAGLDYPDFDFKICDASRDLDILGGDFDIVFSNACIQWIPDHPRLLKNMMGLLRKGGMLAVQTPLNDREPIHLIIDEVAGSQEWKTEFSGSRIFYNLSQSEYFNLLSQISSAFSIWETVYYHALTSHEQILEWYRGTGLRPYLNVLPDEKKHIFEQEILKRLKEEYPLQKNGKIIFKFPRLFFIAEL